MTDIVYTKVCTKCGIEKSIDEFGNNKQSRDGKRSDCKDCHNKSNKSYSDAHKEQISLYHKKRREENPDLTRSIANASYHRNKHNWQEYRKRYADEHKEKIAIYVSQWAKDNPDKKRQSSRKYREENREKTRELSRLYKINNLEKCREGYRKYNKANPLKRREINAAYRARKRDTKVDKIDYYFIINRDNGICGICNENVFPEDLHFDHIIPLSKGGTHEEKNIQVSHSWCNLSKNAKVL